MSKILLTRQNNRYVLLFSNDNEQNCLHQKKLLKVENYTFVYCKKTQNPIAIYLPDIENIADLYTLNKISTLVGAIKSIFLKKLVSALLENKIEFVN